MPPADKLRIYLVEDEALIAMELDDRLKALGYEVCGRAARGETALEEIPRLGPDLVLMDIQLAGGINGIETATRLRPLRDVPVVFLTAFSDDKMIRAAIGASPFGYLVKPFEERVLHATLQAAFYKHQVEQLLRQDKDRLAAAVQERTAQLHESEALLRDLFDGTSDLIQSVASDGRLLFANRAWREALGYTAEETEQLDLSKIIHPECREHCQAIFARLMQGEEVGVVEVVFVTRDGRRVEVEGNVSIRYLAGKPVSTRGVFRDVTARKRIETVIKRQAGFFTTLHQVTVELLGQSEQAELLQSLARRCALHFEAFQVEVNLLEGDALFIRGFQSEAGPRLGERLTRSEAPLSWQAVDRGEPVIVENYPALPGALEENRRLGITAAAVFPIMHGRQCLGTLGIVRKPPGRSFSPEEISQGQLFAQITALVLHKAIVYDEARREAEGHTLALRKNEAQLQLASQIARLGYWEYCVTKDEFKFNDQFYSVLRTTAEREGGYTMASARYAARFVHPDDVGMVGKEIAQALASTDPGYHHSVDHRVIFGDGSPGYIFVHIQLEKDASGKTIRTRGVIVDITTRKQAEVELTEAAALLRATLDSTADGILTVDLKGTILSFSQRFLEMWRIPAEVLAARDDSQAVRTVLEQLAEPDKFVERVRYLYDHPLEEGFDSLAFKDGRVYERYSRPMLVGGKPAGRVWSFRDVTERQNTSRALTRAHERTLILAQLGRELAEVATPRTAALATLEAAQHLLGWDCAWLQLWDEQNRVFVDPVNFDLIDGERREVPSNPVALRHPSPAIQRAMTEGAYLHLRESETEAIADSHLFGADRRSLSRMFVPIRRGVRLLGVLSIQSYRRQAYDQAALELLQTLAEHCAGAFLRIQAREELDRVQKQFRSVWDSALDGMRLADGDGLVLAVNDAYCRLMGKPREEMEGQMLSVIFAEAEREAALARHRERFRRRESTHSVEREIPLWDGRTLWIDVTTSYIESDTARPLVLTSVRDISGRRRAEAAVRESEERFRLASQAVFDVIWDLDLRTGVIWRNEHFQQLFGYTREDEKKMGEFSWLHPDDRDQVIASAKAALAGGGQVWADSYRYRRKDGSYAYVEDRAQIIRDAAGQPVRLIGAMRDVTERKAAEFALRENETRFRTLVETVSQGYYVTNRRSLFTYCNPTVLAVVGRTQAEMLGTSVFRYIAEEDRLRVIAAFGKWMQDGSKETSIEFRMPTAAGKMVWVEQTTTFHRDDQGRVLEARCIVRDATERKAAEKLVRESEELFRGVFEASPIPILLSTAPEGRLTDVNTTALRLFGFTREEVLGRTTVELNLWVSPAQREEFFRRIATEKTVTVFEAHMRTKAGEERVMLCTGTLLTVAGQVRVLASAVDITTVRQIEAEQARMQQKLLTNQKFEALGTLAGGVAHDFNNILTGVINYTQLAQSDLPAGHPQIKEFLGEVLKCGQRAKDLVRQILLFSRSEETERVPIPLQPVIKEVVALLRSTIPAAIAIKSELEMRAPPVLANASQIHQVVMNLGINAAHAMQERGGTLTIGLRPRTVDAALAAESPELRPGPHVCLEVTDTGAGMEAAVIARIFEPFFTTKKVGEGTGLGLAVVHSVMRNHEGAIKVRSQPGAGTTFELFFPVQTAAAANPTGPRNLAHGRGQRILLVDDEVAVGQSLKILLERLGYKVTVFTNPAHALLRWEAAPGDFDALLTDYQMPGMTGTVLAKKILAGRPGLPVFIMSGFAGTNSPQRLRAEGFMDFLSKPIDLEDLTAKLARVLG